MAGHTFSWTDIEDIAIELAETHPDKDPVGVRFTELRELVENLDGFEPEPGQSPNEQILEAIQAGWIEEREDMKAADDDDDDGPGYQPNNPFR